MGNPAKPEAVESDTLSRHLRPFDPELHTIGLLMYMVSCKARLWRLQVHNEAIVRFIREKNEETQFTVSNCAGASLIGASGIADGHKIVTWIGGGKQLQKDYPNLLVQDDSVVTYMKDGMFLSSNGNLASYIPALELLEILSGPEQRKFIESYLYLDRLQKWQ